MVTCDAVPSSQPSASPTSIPTLRKLYAAISIHATSLYDRKSNIRLCFRSI